MSWHLTGTAGSAQDRLLFDVDVDVDADVGIGDHGRPWCVRA